MEKKNLSIRIDEKTLQKFRMIADNEKRSINKQIIMLIKECIAGFEESHGPIEKQE